MSRKGLKKQSHVKQIIGIVIIVLIFVFFILFQFFGLNSYLSAVSNIEELHSDYRKFAVDLFYGANNNAYIYNGTLGFITINKTGYPTIWIWGRNGLEYFVTDSNTDFSNYRICLGDEWKTGNGTVKRNYNVGVKNWISGVRQGDFVGVELGNDKAIGVFSYDWWIFKPYTKSELIKVCQKR